ncbi:MAG: pyridoxal-phosphate dependent enzyme [Gemmatimonadaceae bacterium]
MLPPNTDGASEITINRILAARERITPYLSASPTRNYPLLDELVGYGIRVLVKHENHLPVNSFKVRNGLSAVTALALDVAARGVIAASTGNHGQGVAYAGRQLGIPVVIFVPANNNPEKNALIRALGAELVEVGASYDECISHCKTRAEQDGLTLIHSTNNADVIAGAGTLTLELVEQHPEVSAMVVAVGGGSQAVGAITVAAAHKPSMRVFGVQSAEAPGQFELWRTGEFSTAIPSKTFAEGIATARGYEMTYGLLRRGLEDFVLVSDKSIAQAVRDLWRVTHNLAEGAGAAGFAGLRELAPRLEGQTVAVIMSGSNLDTQRAIRVLSGAL